MTAWVGPLPFSIVCVLAFAAIIAIALAVPFDDGGPE